MKKVQKRNAIKRIIILLIILLAVIVFKGSIGEEFEHFLTNYYIDQHNISVQKNTL